MQRLHRIHFDVLRQQRGGCLVTLHVPPEERRHDRLRQLWSEAEEQLTREEARAVLDPVRYLVEDLPFWASSSLSLSVFSRETQHFVVGSPYAVEPRAVVGHRFYLAPLLPLLQEDYHFYVLEVRPDDSRLYTGDIYHLRELTCPELPPKLVHCLQREPYPNPDLDTWLAESVRGAPVVVTGPQLLRQTIVIPSVRRLDVEDSVASRPLFERVWERLRRQGDDERRQALGRASSLTSQREEILAAVSREQIATLVVGAGVEVWGVLEQGRWRTTEVPTRAAEELINRVSLDVLASGGRVFVAPAQELAPAAGMVAGLGADHLSLLRAG